MTYNTTVRWQTDAIGLLLCLQHCEDTDKHTQIPFSKFQLDALSFHLTLCLKQPNYITGQHLGYAVAGFADRDSDTSSLWSVESLTNNPTQGHQLSRILDNIEYGSWTSHNKYTVHKWQIAHIPGWLVFWCFHVVSVHLVLLCLTSLQCLSFTGRRLTVLFKPGQDVGDQSAACNRLLP